MASLLFWNWGRRYASSTVKLHRRTYLLVFSLLPGCRAVAAVWWFAKEKMLKWCRSLTLLTGIFTTNFPNPRSIPLYLYLCLFTLFDRKLVSTPFYKRQNSGPPNLFFGQFPISKGFLCFSPPIHSLPLIFFFSPYFPTYAICSFFSFSLVTNSDYLSGILADCKLVPLLVVHGAGMLLLPMIMVMVVNNYTTAFILVIWGSPWHNGTAHAHNRVLAFKVANCWSCKLNFC